MLQKWRPLNVIDKLNSECRKRDFEHKPQILESF